MNTFNKCLVSIGSIGISFTTHADINNQLERLCTQADVTTKQVVKIGPSQRVDLLQGGMLLIENDGVAPTKELLLAELAALGIAHDCREYFVSNGMINQADGRVYFDFDSYQLTPASKQILDSLIDKVRRSPSTIVFAGHTDSTGAERYNFALGLKRANEVKGHMVASGIDSQKLDSVSFGELQPIASNETQEGRKMNRRVEFKLGEEQ